MMWLYLLKPTSLIQHWISVKKVLRDKYLRLWEIRFFNLNKKPCEEILKKKTAQIIKTDVERPFIWKRREKVKFFKMSEQQSPSPSFGRNHALVIQNEPTLFMKNNELEYILKPIYSIDRISIVALRYHIRTFRFWKLKTRFQNSH